MAEVILAADKTNSETLTLTGGYKLVCLTYGSAQVDLQVRDPEVSTTWVSLRQGGGQPTRFDRVGEAYDINFAGGFEYRLNTATAGAVIAMSPLSAMLVRS